MNKKETRSFLMAESTILEYRNISHCYTFHSLYIAIMYNMDKKGRVRSSSNKIWLVKS